MNKFEIGDIVVNVYGCERIPNRAEIIDISEDGSLTLKFLDKEPACYYNKPDMYKLYLDKPLKGRYNE